MEERLWDYIDGRTDAAEKAAVEALLATDGAARALYEELLAVHGSLTGIGLEEPSLRFTKNVMEAIGAPAISYVNKRVIRLIAAFLLAPIVGVVIYALVQSGGLPDGTVGPKIQLPTVKIPDIQLNPYLSIVFVFIAVVSGFVGLDAFLQRRRKPL